MKDVNLIEEAIKKVIFILNDKNRLSKSDKILIKTLIWDLFTENKKLKEEKNE